MSLSIGGGGSNFTPQLFQALGLNSTDLTARVGNVAGRLQQLQSELQSIQPASEENSSDRKVKIENEVVFACKWEKMGQQVYELVDTIGIAGEDLLTKPTSPIPEITKMTDKLENMALVSTRAPSGLYPSMLADAASCARTIMLDVIEYGQIALKEAASHAAAKPDSLKSQVQAVTYYETLATTLSVLSKEMGQASKNIAETAEMDDLDVHARARLLELADDMDIGAKALQKMMYEQPDVNVAKTNMHKQLLAVNKNQNDTEFDLPADYILNRAIITKEFNKCIKDTEVQAPIISAKAIKPDSFLEMVEDVALEHMNSASDSSFDFKNHKVSSDAPSRLEPFYMTWGRSLAYWVGLHSAGTGGASMSQHENLANQKMSEQIDQTVAHLVEHAKDLQTLSAGHPELSRQIEKTLNNAQSLTLRLKDLSVEEKIAQSDATSKELTALSTLVCNTIKLEGGCMGINFDTLSWVPATNAILEVVVAEGLDDTFSKDIAKVIKEGSLQQGILTGGAQRLPLFRQEGQKPLAILRAKYSQVLHDPNIVAQILDQHKAFGVPPVALVKVPAGMIGRQEFPEHTAVVMKPMDHDRTPRLMPQQDSYEVFKVPQRVMDVLGKTELQKIFLFDVLLQNMDRHTGNILFKDNKAIPIDHDRCSTYVDVEEDKYRLFSDRIGGMDSIWYQSGFMRTDILEAPLSDEVRAIFKEFNVEQAEKQLLALPIEYLVESYEHKKDSFSVNRDKRGDYIGQKPVNDPKTWIQKHVHKQALGLWAAGTATKALAAVCSTPKELLERASHEINDAHHLAIALARIKAKGSSNPVEETENAYKLFFSRLVTVAASGDALGIQKEVTGILVDLQLPDMNIRTFEKLLASKDLKTNLPIYVRAYQLARAQALGTIGAEIPSDKKEQVLNWASSHFTSLRETPLSKEAFNNKMQNLRYGFLGAKIRGMFSSTDHFAGENS